MANEVQLFEMVGDRSGSEARPVTFRAKQTLTIGGAASAAFDPSTTYVTIVSTTSCVIEFGTAPDGLGNTFPIVAGQLYDFAAYRGQKVIAVAGTATAPTPGLASGAATAANQASELARLPASLGSKAASASFSVTPGGLEYETVAASQTAQALGATGATGDYLSHVVIQPTTTAAGTTTILDNATVIFTFTAGTLADLRPIIVPVNAFSVSGAWKITTGANVTATGFGDFT